MVTLKDKRVFFLGVNTGFVIGGNPDDRFVEFYRERCSSHLYCAILGNVVVPEGYGSNDVTPVLSGDKSWAKVADTIRLEGSVPGIQLATAWPNYAGQRKFIAQDTVQVIREAQQVVASMDDCEIEAILCGFEKGASLAVDHGYRHVQIHAAHGYLPNLLIDEDINPRAAFVQERLAGLAESMRRQGVETSIRWSLDTGDPNFDRRGAIAGLAPVARLPFDLVDLSSGYYNINKRLIYPSTPSLLEQRWQESVKVAAHYSDVRFIISGRAFGHLGELPENADLGLCRDLIANPSFLIDPSNGCRNRGKCHYHSRGEASLTCPTWLENAGKS